MFVWWGPRLINIYNDAYAPMLGKRHPDALGRSAPEIWADVWPVVGPQTEAVMRRGESTWNERVMLVMERHGYTENAWFTFSYSPIRDEAGAVGGLFCAVTEETERVRAEEERRQLVERYAFQSRLFDRMLSSIADFAYTFDLDGRFTFVNKPLLDLWGLTLDEAVGKNFFDLKYPHDLAAKLQRQIGEVIATRQLVVDETPYTSLTGRGGFYQYILSPIFDADGRVEAVAGSTRDLTERRRAEESLRTSEERFALAVDAAELGTFHCPMPMGSIVWNDKCKEHFWLPADAEVDFERFYAVIHPDDRDHTRAAIERALFEHQPYDVEYRTVAPDGRMRWVRAKGRAYHDATGTATRFDGVTLDVTEQKRAEDAVRVSEERYRNLFTSIDEGFCLCEMVLDAAGQPVDYRFLEVNPAFEKLTKLTSAVGRTARELVPDLEDRWIQIYARVGLQGETLRFERTSEAMGRTFNVFASPIEPIGSGKFTLVFSDITDRKRAEEVVSESERSLRRQVAEFETLLDVIPVGIGVALDRECRSIRTNPAFAAVLGLQVGQNASKTAPANERPTTFRCLDEHGGEIADAELPMQIAARDGKIVDGVEFDIVHDDGRVVRLLEYAAPLFDEAGEPRGCVGAFVDVTEKSATAERLRQSEEQFRVIANSIPQLAWMAQPDGWIFWYNDRWYDYTGTTLEQMQEWGWENMHDPAELDRMLVTWKAALASGESWEDTFPLRRHDGELRWHLTRAMPLRDEAGNVVFWFGTNTDIHDAKLLQEQNERLLASERAAREEAERASEAKSEFLATLSHELRTPLTPVLLTVSLMEADPQLPDFLREDVAAIRRNVELESRLISDLLDLTRIVKGKLQLDMQNVDLHLVIRSAIDICRHEASTKLVVKLAARRHTVRGDSTRLHQIFWNLLNNAIKFTGLGGAITVRTVDLPDGRIRVDVSDTGAGIDSDVLPKLFTAFEQGDIRTGRQQAGLGLGLAISRKLAEMHGGTIEASSAGRQQGSTFTVELPATDLITSEQSPLRPARHDVARRPLSVLLVEDHEPTLAILARLLRQLGHRVTKTSSVSSAIAAASEDGFDLIISDLGLPDGSGLDIMRALRDRYADRAIALTGYGAETDIAASREAGFAEHLVKPIDMTALEDAMHRIVAMSHR